MLITVAKEKKEGSPLASKLVVSIDLSDFTDADYIICKIMRKLNERLNKGNIKPYLDVETSADKTIVDIDSKLINDLMSIVKDAYPTILSLFQMAAFTIDNLKLKRNIVLEKYRKQKVAVPAPSASSDN